MRTEPSKNEFDERPDLPGVIVVDGERLPAVVSRDKLFRHLSGPYCRELFLRKPIRDFSGSGATTSCGWRPIAPFTARPNSPGPAARGGLRADPRRLRRGPLRACWIPRPLDRAIAVVVALQASPRSSATRPKRPIAPRANFSPTSPTSCARRCTASSVTPVSAQTRPPKAIAANCGEFFQNVDQGAETLLRLVNDLLDLSKLEAGRMTCELQPDSVGDLLGERRRRVQFAVRGAAECRSSTAPPDEDTTAMVDPERFKQVIRNLLSNAVKFSPPQGTVNVRVRRLAHALLDQRPRRRAGHSARRTGNSSSTSSSNRARRSPAAAAPAWDWRSAARSSAAHKRTHLGREQRRARAASSTANCPWSQPDAAPATMLRRKPADCSLHQLRFERLPRPSADLLP